MVATSLVNVQRGEHGAVDDLATGAHLLAARIEHHVRVYSKRLVASCLQTLIELGHAAADLGSADVDFKANNLLHHRDDFAPRTCPAHTSRLKP